MIIFMSLYISQTNYQPITKQMAPNRINPNSAQPMLNQTMTSPNRINASSDKKTNWRQFLPSLLSFQQPGNSRQAGNNGNNDRQQQKNSTRQENVVKQSSTGKARSYNLATQRFLERRSHDFQMWMSAGLLAYLFH